MSVLGCYVLVNGDGRVNMMRVVIRCDLAMDVMSETIVGTQTSSWHANRQDLIVIVTRSLATRRRS